MNTDIQEAETILSDIGRRCNPRLVERKHAHARQMKKDTADKGKKLPCPKRRAMILEERRANVI